MLVRQECTYTSGSTLTLTSTFTVASDIGGTPSLTARPCLRCPLCVSRGANGADVTIVAEQANPRVDLDPGRDQVTFTIDAPG